MAAVSPELPLSPRQTAEVQLYQNGHSSIAQHFWKVKIGDADIVKKLDSPFALLPVSSGLTPAVKLKMAASFLQ